MSDTAREGFVNAAGRTKRQPSTIEQLSDDRHDAQTAFQRLVEDVAHASEDLRQLDEKVRDTIEERDRAHRVWFEAKTCLDRHLKAQGVDL